MRGPLRLSIGRWSVQPRGTPAQASRRARLGLLLIGIDKKRCRDQVVAIDLAVTVIHY